MISLKLTTSGRTGKQWLAHLKKEKYRVSSWAEEIILSPEFDKAHLPKGAKITIELVKTSHLNKLYATTEELKTFAAEKGWEVPSSEVALLIRESVSDETMKELGIWYIAALHDPIKDSADGIPGVLYAGRDGGGRWVGADWGSPVHQWGTEGAFAFVVPASAQDSDPKPSSEPSDLALRVQALEEWRENINRIFAKV